MRQLAVLPMPIAGEIIALKESRRLCHYLALADHPAHICLPLPPDLERIGLGLRPQAHRRIVGSADMSGHRATVLVAAPFDRPAFLIDICRPLTLAGRHPFVPGPAVLATRH